MECGKLTKGKQYTVDVHLNNAITSKLVDFDPKALTTIKLMTKSNLFVLTADEVTVEPSDHIIYDDVARTYRHFTIPKPKFKNPKMLVSTHNQITQQLEQAVAGALRSIGTGYAWTAATGSQPTVTLEITDTGGYVHSFNTNSAFALFDPNSNIVTWVMVFVDQSNSAYTTQSAQLSSNAFNDANIGCASGIPCVWCVAAIQNPITMATATVSITKQASQTLVFVWTIQIQLPSGSLEGGLFTYYVFLWYLVATGAYICSPNHTWSVTVIENGQAVNYSTSNFILATPNGQFMFGVLGVDTNVGSNYTVTGGSLNISQGTFPVSINYTKQSGTVATYLFVIGIQPVTI